VIQQAFLLLVVVKVPLLGSSWRCPCRVQGEV